MWFLLPPRMLPVVVCGSLSLRQLPDSCDGKPRSAGFALFVGSSWFSVGPALVLYFVGSHPPRWSSPPIYVAALGAQFLFDYRLQLPDACGASEHLAAAQLARSCPRSRSTRCLRRSACSSPSPRTGTRWRSYGVLPVLLLFSTFARERQHRIDNALELSNAYRGTAMLLGDVIEADDAYTGESQP